MKHKREELQKIFKEIGKRFQEELDKEGYREHRIIVTAMFRTRRDIAIAQQTNSSTNDNSAHLYGTTFDISFSRFNLQVQVERLLTTKLCAIF